MGMELEAEIDNFIINGSSKDQNIDSGNGRNM
jgi:hypothetical protein